VLSHFKFLALLVSLILTSFFSLAAQENKTSEKPKKAEKQKQQNTDLSKNATADQVAESVIFVFGGGGGRANLQQIRRTAIERGRLNITNADGTTEQASYEKRILRGDNLEKERIRVDQEFPTAKYALIYNDNKVSGLFNESVFTPREDASKAFQNQLWHGIEALLRYKENGATLELAKREKFMNVEYFVLDVTDKQSRKTRFFISAKSFRVMWLEYTQDAIKYTRRFYDYRYAQGTLVPYRTVLLANDKQIEETTISTVTFGQKLEEDVFLAG